MNNKGVAGLRPFIPAKDFEVSKRFYKAIGFELRSAEATVAEFGSGAFGFVLQNYYQEAWAENSMVQLLVHDVDAWWKRLDTATLMADFGVKPPRAPAMQPWGLVVGFIFDPSGVLWHVAQVAA